MTDLVRGFGVWAAVCLMAVCGLVAADDSTVTEAERRARAAEKTLTEIGDQLDTARRQSRSADDALQKTDERIRQLREEANRKTRAREETALARLRGVEKQLVEADSELAVLLAGQTSLERTVEEAEQRVARSRQAMQDALAALRGATSYKDQRDAMRALRQARSEADAAQKAALAAKEQAALSSTRVTCQRELIRKLEDQTESLSEEAGGGVAHRERLLADGEALMAEMQERHAGDSELHAERVADLVGSESKELSALHGQLLGRGAKTIARADEAESRVQDLLAEHLQRRSDQHETAVAARERLSSLAGGKESAEEAAQEAEGELARLAAAAAETARVEEERKLREAARKRDAEAEERRRAQEVARARKRARGAVTRLANAEEAARTDAATDARTQLASLEEETPEAVAEARAWHDARVQAANATQWDFSIGMTHRHFDDATFVGRDFPAAGLQASGTVASGPADSAANRAAAQSNGPYGLQGISSTLQEPDVTVLPTFEGTSQAFGVTIPLDYVTYNGSNEGIESSTGTGLTLALNRTLLKSEAWRFGLVSNVQYYSFDQSTTRGGNMFGDDGMFTSAQYVHTLVDVDSTPLDGVIVPVINPAAAQNVPPAAGSSTEFHVRNSLSMDLVAWDVGCRIDYVHGRFTLDLSFGPSLTFVDAESRQRLFASWNDTQASFPNPPLAASPATLNAGTHTREHVDSNKSVAFGGYASLGLSYKLTPFMSTVFDVRYDAVDGTATTDDMRMDLDGYSLQLKLRYRF